MAAVATKGALETVPPVTLLVTQTLTRSLFLGAMARLQGTPLLRLSHTLRAGSPGLLMPGISDLLYVGALTLTAASVVTLIETLDTFPVMAMGWALLREPVSRIQGAMAGVATLGVMLASTQSEPAKGSWQGMGLALAATLCYAFYAVSTRKQTQEFAPMSLAVLHMAFGLLFALLVWPIALGRGEAPALSTIPFHAWMFAGFSGLLDYAISYWLYLTALSSLQTSTVAICLTLIPAFSLAGAWLFLGERFGGMQSLGAVLVLLATGIMALTERKSAPLRMCLSTRK